MPRRGHWHFYAGPVVDFSKDSRQQRRANRRRNAMDGIRKQFGGFTDRGGYYYAEGMTRRIARQIARDAA